MELLCIAFRMVKGRKCILSQLAYRVMINKWLHLLDSNSLWGQRFRFIIFSASKSIYYLDTITSTLPLKLKNSTILHSLDLPPTTIVPLIMPDDLYPTAPIWMLAKSILLLDHVRAWLWVLQSLNLKFWFFAPTLPQFP